MIVTSTRCKHPVAVAFLEPRTEFPSMAMGTRPVAPIAADIHRSNAAANAVGSSLANTRSNVSGLGMPFSSARNRRKKVSLARPNTAMPSHDSAPPMTAHVAMTRMSDSRWSLFWVSRRGSGRSAKTTVSGSDGIGSSSVTSRRCNRNPYHVTGS